MSKEKFELVEGKNIKLNETLSPSQMALMKGISEAMGGAYSTYAKVFVFETEQGAVTTLAMVSKSTELQKEYPKAELLDNTIKINSMSKGQFMFLKGLAEKNGGVYDKETKTLTFKTMEDAGATFSKVYKDKADALAKGAENKADASQKEEKADEKKSEAKSIEKAFVKGDVANKVNINRFLQSYEFATYATVASTKNGEYVKDEKAFVFDNGDNANLFFNEVENKDVKQLQAEYPREEAKQSQSTRNRNR